MPQFEPKVLIRNPFFQRVARAVATQPSTPVSVNKRKVKKLRKLAQQRRRRKHGRS